MAESKFTPLVCVYCSTSFVPTDKRQTLCSKTCKMKGWKRDNYRAPKPFVAKVSVCIFKYCQWCKVAFQTRRDDCYTCSSECRYAIWARSVHRREARETTCCDCGLTFCPTFGSSHAIRCALCAEANAIEDRRNHKAARKAITRGNHTERIDVTKVFRDYGWRCYICNLPTPEALCGSHEDRAPELDHITPISRGGAHTYSNVALACRLCNQNKGAKLLTEYTLPKYYG